MRASGVRACTWLRQRRTRPSRRRRFSFGKFGLDVGALYYGYPARRPGVGHRQHSISFVEFYAKPSYKVTDWLTIGGIVAYSNNAFNSGLDETY